MTALYFKSRKNFKDMSTWRKEKLPKDYTNSDTTQWLYVDDLLPKEGGEHD